MNLNKLVLITTKLILNYLVNFENRELNCSIYYGTFTSVNSVLHENCDNFLISRVKYYVALLCQHNFCLKTVLIILYL